MKDKAGTVRGEDVRQMLGLADRTRTIDLFEAVMKGDVAAALKELREQYDIGADPAVALADLAEFTHFVTRVKVVPSVADDVSFAEAERLRGRGFAEKLSMRVLARAWQMLLKGITEVEEAGRPLAAAEMVLVRLAYAADMPTPDEVIRSLDGNGAAPVGRASGNGGSAATASTSGSSAPRFDGPRGDVPRGGPRAALASVQPVGDPIPAQAADSAPALVVGRFEELIALAASRRDISVKASLERDVRLVRCEDGRLEIALEQSAPKGLVNDLARKFSQWTGRRWMVVVSGEQGEPTVRSQNEARQAELKTGVRADPVVQAVLARFPGAEIVHVRKPDASAALPSGEPDDVIPEPPPADDGSYGADWREDC